MVKSGFLVFGIVGLGFITACQQDFELGKEISKAVREGKTEVVVPAGRYTIDESVKIEGYSDLTVKSDGSGDVVITTGMSLSLDDFTCLDSVTGLYEITMPEFKSDTWPDSFRGYAAWPEIYINHIPLRLARWPNEGYAKIDSVISKGSIPGKGDTLKQGGRFISDSLASRLILKSDIFLGGYWCYKWYDEFIRIASVDTVRGEIQLAAPHQYGIGGPSGGLFYAINIPEELDMPGEYYYNHETGTLRFLLPDNAGANPVIEAGYQNFTMIELNNCRNIHFEGINFTGNNGFAVSVVDCDSVSFRNCDFTDFAQSVVMIKGGSYCGLDSCEISQAGATGVILDGGDRQSLHPAGHYVINSNIHHFARHVRTYAPAVNLHGVGNYVGYNYIHDAPHNAILFHGNDHLIEYNKIERVCWDTSDAGAIYCGRDWTMGGTVIQYNSFSNLGKANHHHNWAIYLDDLASGIDVLYNDIEDCPSGILVGGGRYNRLIGNKIVNCHRASIMYDARGVGWYQPYIKDPDHTLWTRLAEMPVDQSPWKERFPWLQKIADDDPSVPKHAVIIDNKIINSRYPDIHPLVVEYGDVHVSVIDSH